jgi:hypothetical protein
MSPAVSGRRTAVERRRMLSYETSVTAGSSYPDCHLGYWCQVGLPRSCTGIAPDDRAQVAPTHRGRRHGTNRAATCARPAGQAHLLHPLPCARKPALRLLRDLKVEQLARVVVATVSPGRPAAGRPEPRPSRCCRRRTLPPPADHRPGVGRDVPQERHRVDDLARVPGRDGQAWTDARRPRRTPRRTAL